MTNHLFSIDAALAHLRAADPVLAGVIDHIGPYEARRRSDPYLALVRTILYQQLAGAAAAAIERRFYALFGNEGPPRPEQLLECPDEQLRSAGISRQKAAYLRDLALHVLDGRLDFAALPALDDAEVSKRITAVHGLGEWSAHMFLMFHLGRPDVLPVGDLGMRNGMRIAYGLAEMPTPARAREIAAPWAPFRSVGSWYMWRVTEPVAQDI
jgi:DNA-3-methyladenine glycosylase II